LSSISAAVKKFFQKAFKNYQVFYRYFRQKGFRRFLKENILESEGSNSTKAKSVALGIFISLSPFWGFHSFLAITLSVYFKTNKLLTFMASQLTLPPLIPLVVFSAMAVGAPFVSETPAAEPDGFSFEFIQENVLQYVIGSMILATAGAFVFGLLTYGVLQIFRTGSGK